MGHGESKRNEGRRGLRRTVPVAEERLRVGKRWRKTGRVAVHVVPRTRPEVVDVELRGERAEVERIPIHREVERPYGPREEGDVTVVPIFEEVLVVEKKLMLVEEVRIRRRTTTRRERREVPVRREEVRVLRSEERRRR